jgi:thioredoxin-related protein
MSKIYKKTELLANALIIVVAILIVGGFAQRYFSTTRAKTSRPDLPKVGDKVGLPDFDWSKSNKNVLLALQKNCHFCSDSAGFYQKLLRELKATNVNIVAVLPQEKEEARQYLNGLGLSGIEVRQSQLDTLLVAGTPTIIVANQQGEITDVWFGKLQPEQENEVLTKLKG